MKSALVLLHVTLFGAVTAHATPPQTATPLPSANPSQPSAVTGPSDPLEGKRLFQLYCAPCHGANGQGGRGPILAVPVLARAKTDQALLGLVMGGIPGTEMPPTFLEPPQLKSIVAWVRKLGETPAQKITGDARNGQQLYMTRGNCASCHAIKGEGGVTGPDLTEIGLRRGVDYLRQSLLEPEAEVPENFFQFRWHTVIPDNFLQVKLVTRDRQELTGARLNEDPFTIQIRELSGKIRSFAKADLIELRKEWGKSFMPSYRDLLSASELDDVVAYLLSLRGAK